MSVEAVNSVLQSAPVVRASVEQTSTADSYAANPQRVQKVAEAPYVSPRVSIDLNTNIPVLQIRNPETGDVLEQIPSQVRLQAQRQTQLEQKKTDTQPHQQQATIPVPVAAANAPQQSNPTPAPEVHQQQQAATQQQIAAFAAAARSGNSNAGSVSLFA